MKKQVILSIRGRQTYMEQAPEEIELVTEGVLEQTPEGWKLSYEESDLTGLQGVHTTFLAEPGKLTLSRTGRLASEMVFQEGVCHDSLYRMEFGTMLITVCATRVQYTLDEQGGSVDLHYGIEVEQSAAGTIEYHLEVRVKE